MPRPRAAACTQSHEDACARRMPRPAVVSTMLRGSPNICRPPNWRLGCDARAATGRPGSARSAARRALVGTVTRAVCIRILGSPLQASDGAAEASRRVSRTATRVLEGYLARGCGARQFERHVRTSIAPRCACALRLFAHVVELGGLERLACTPIVARSNCGRNGITWRDIKKSFRAPRRILSNIRGRE